MEHGISSCWFQHRHFEHDIYLMIVKEPGSPDLWCGFGTEAFSYIGRISGRGQHPCFSVHFACPPYGHDYPTTRDALEAGLAHGRAVIEVWRGPWKDLSKTQRVATAAR